VGFLSFKAPAADRSAVNLEDNLMGASTQESTIAEFISASESLGDACWALRALWSRTQGGKARLNTPIATDVALAAVGIAEFLEATTPVLGHWHRNLVTLVARHHLAVHGKALHEHRFVVSLLRDLIRPVCRDNPCVEIEVDDPEFRGQPKTFVVPNPDRLLAEPLRWREFGTVFQNFANESRSPEPLPTLPAALMLALDAPLVDMRNRIERERSLLVEEYEQREGIVVSDREGPQTVEAAPPPPEPPIDGCLPPSTFCHNGEPVELSPLQYRMVESLWLADNRQQELDDWLDYVWDGDEPAATSINSAISKLNSRLLEADIALTVSQKNGWVTLR
jgi:hypothetical protein